MHTVVPAGFSLNQFIHYLILVLNYLILTSLSYYFCTLVPLTLIPRSGNMLGGTEVIISGPCFESSNARAVCRFDNDQVDGVVLSASLALCTTPEMTRAGLVPFEMEYDGNTYTSTFFSSKYVFH